jgi:hypothetical protein
MKFSKIIYSVCALGSVLGLSAYAADFGPAPARVAAVQNMGGPDFARAAALQNMGGVSPMEVAQAVQKANAGLPLNGRDVQALQAYQASQTLRPGLVGPGMAYYANNAGRRLSPAEVALLRQYSLANAATTPDYTATTSPADALYNAYLNYQND